MLFKSFLKYLLFFLDIIVYKKWSNQPLIKKPIANKNKYIELWKKACEQNNPDVNFFEKKTGYKIDNEWLNNLALRTQIVIKKVN